MSLFTREAGGNEIPNQVEVSPLFLPTDFVSLQLVAINFKEYFECSVLQGPRSYLHSMISPSTTVIETFRKLKGLNVCYYA